MLLLGHLAPRGHLPVAPVPAEEEVVKGAVPSLAGAGSCVGPIEPTNDLHNRREGQIAEGVRHGSPIRLPLVGAHGPINPPCRPRLGLLLNGGTGPFGGGGRRGAPPRWLVAGSLGGGRLAGSMLYKVWGWCWAWCAGMRWLPGGTHCTALREASAP